MAIIKLPCFDIEIHSVSRNSDESGSITSSLHEDDESDELKAALDAIEAMILAHAIAGVEVRSDAYLEGIETAVEAVFNHIN